MSALVHHTLHLSVLREVRNLEHSQPQVSERAASWEFSAGARGTAAGPEAPCKS